MSNPESELMAKGPVSLQAIDFSRAFRKFGSSSQLANSMKTTFRLGVYALLPIFAYITQAQQTTTATVTSTAQTNYAVVHREANERTWQRTVQKVLPSGKTVSHVECYEELGIGICHIGTNGQWIDSIENISLLPDGSACSTNGEHQVYYPVDIGSGTIQMVYQGLTLKVSHWD